MQTTSGILEEQRITTIFNQIYKLIKKLMHKTLFTPADKGKTLRQGIDLGSIHYFIDRITSLLNFIVVN